MAGLIKMRAKAPLATLKGERFRAGQVFSVSPAEAAAMRYQRKADFAADSPDDTPPPPVVQPQQDQPDVNEDNEPAQDTPTHEARGRGRGRYARRDLQAEGSKASE